MRDLAAQESADFETLVLVPRVPGAPRTESIGGVAVRRFRYFPRRWEDLAHGAIIENLRSHRWRWAQVPFFFAAQMWAVGRAVRRHRPDVVHVHWIIPQGISALLAARRVPWLVTTLGGDVYALRDPVSLRLKRAVLRRSRVVTTMNEDMRTRLLALGAPPSATSVLPMGADVDVIRAAGAGVARVPGLVLFVGRLVEKKGVSVLLEALRRLADDGSRSGPTGGPGWSLRVIGDGPLRAELEAAAWGLPVTFSGALGRAQLAAAYATADVVVFPSVPASSGDQDGLPVALIEAMAAGCAVVASALPGIDAAVVDGRCGLLVPPGDPAALAAALRRVLGDDVLRQRLREAAAARADEFSVAAIGARYRTLLHAAMNGNVESST